MKNKKQIENEIKRLNQQLKFCTAPTTTALEARIYQLIWVLETSVAIKP